MNLFLWKFFYDWWRTPVPKIFRYSDLSLFLCLWRGITPWLGPSVEWSMDLDTTEVIVGSYCWVRGLDRSFIRMSGEDLNPPVYFSLSLGNPFLPIYVFLSLLFFFFCGFWVFAYLVLVGFQEVQFYCDDWFWRLVSSVRVFLLVVNSW